MQFFIGVTDNNWFHFLAERQPDELNFWRPSGAPFRALDEGGLFLFKLHSPYNFIVGGGFFVRSSQLPLSLAWEAFGEKNGAADYGTFYEQIRKYRAARGTMELNPIIGCIVLVQPFFFAESQWIAVPRDWSPNIVQGKGYDTATPIGREVWEQVQARLADQLTLPLPLDQPGVLAEERARYGSDQIIRPRLGQGAFRVVITEAYQRRCAITGERTLPTLQASHIKPYARSGPHAANNGLLLRADLHILFDQGYLTVTDDYRVEVSGRIREEFENGRDYYALHGQPLTVLPAREIERPAADFIAWHNDHIYVG